MAIVTIVIADMDNEMVDILAYSEPPMEDEEKTVAQQIAMEFCNNMESRVLACQCTNFEMEN